MAKIKIGYAQRNSKKKKSTDFSFLIATSELSSSVQDLQRN